MLALALALWLAAEGRPLFYWGARPAVIAVPARRTQADDVHARVTDVHVAVDNADVVVRFTFDRQVREALRLPDGSPVSGRLHAMLEIDADDDRATGLAAGPKARPADLREGADRRIDIATRYLGADPDEQRAASVEVTARMASVSADGRLRTLWRESDAGDGRRLSWHGDSLELRIPADRVEVRARSRFILSGDGGVWEGRMAGAPRGR